MSCCRPFLSCLCVCLALISNAVPAADDEDPGTLSLEQLLGREVLPASRLAQQVSDSPSAVAIVTAADIRAYGYRTLADVINSMRGLFTTYDYRYQYLGGRSFGVPGDYAGRIMLLIDGYATQDSLFNQAYIDESGLLDLDLVERVEYVPGTGSVTYGSNALLGIINVVTRRGGDINATRVAVDFASHGSSRQRVTFGKRFENGGDVLLSASALDVKGIDRYFPAYDTPATNQGVANGLDWERNQRLFGKFTLNGWMLEGAYVDRSKALPSNPNYYTTFNRRFTIGDQNAFLNARHETDLGLNFHSVSRLYYGQYQYDSWREYSDDSDGEKFGQRRFKGQWWGIDQKFVGNWFRDRSIVFGMEYRHDFRQHFQWRYFSPGRALVRELEEDYGRHTTSFHLADEYRLNARWSLNLGVRYDKASGLAGNWSPRVAAIYRPDLQTQLKASYSEAFRMPNANDRSTYGSVVAPEFVAASELVVQHELTPRTRIIGSVYQYRRSKQLVYDAEIGDFVANGSSVSRGLELELESNWEHGARARGSVAWQRAQGTDGAQLPNSPRLLGKFNFTFPIFADRWRTGFETQYIGRRLALVQEAWSSGEVPEQRRLGGVTLTHLTLSSERKWYGFSALLSVRNVFDRRYDVVSPFDWRPDSDIPQETLRMDGRTYWMQLSCDF